MVRRNNSQRGSGMPAWILEGQYCIWKERVNAVLERTVVYLQTYTLGYRGATTTYIYNFAVA